MNNSSYIVFVQVLASLMIALIIGNFILDPWYKNELGIIWHAMSNGFILSIVAATVILIGCVFQAIILDEQHRDRRTRKVKQQELIDHILNGDIEEIPLGILNEHCPTIQDFQHFDREQHVRYAAAAHVKQFFDNT